MSLQISAEDYEQVRRLVGEFKMVYPEAKDWRDELLVDLAINAIADRWRRDRDVGRLA